LTAEVKEMTHKEKVANFKQLLRERGYWRSNAIPPIYQLLWLLGFEIPPPYFLSFWTGVAVAGIPYGCFMGLLMGISSYVVPSYFSSDLSNEFSVFTAVRPIVIGILTGFGFGLLMAIFWRRQAQKLRLPTWENFPVSRS
jgi:Family of unknown function (DUF6404)